MRQKATNHPDHPVMSLSGTGVGFASTTLSAALQVFYTKTSSLFLWVPVLFGLGIAGYFSLSHEPPLWLGGVLCALVLSCCLLAHFKTRDNPGSDVMVSLRLLLLALGLMAAGLLAGQIRTYVVSAPLIERSVETERLIGVIQKKETTRRGALRLLIEVDEIKGLKRRDTPRRVALLARSLGEMEISEGQVIKARARLVPSYRPAYPGAYDPARKDYFAGIGARGRIIGTPEIADIKKATLFTGLQAIRSDLAGHITRAADARAGPGRAWEMGPFAAALVSGKRSGLDTGLVGALRGSGLAHILAISGLHMAIFTGSLFWLARALMSLSTRMALTKPIKKYAAVIALFGGAFYLAISGAPVSAERAYIMASVMFLAILFDRHAISLHNLAIAATLILVLRPESLLSISFQMSFASVAALIAFYEAWRARRPKLLQNLGAWHGVIVFFISIALTTLIATLATAPFVSHYFGKIPAFGLVANLLVMPVFTLVTMPLALIGVVLYPLGLSGFFFDLMGNSLSLITSIAASVSRLEGAVQIYPQISIAALGAFVVAGLWLVLWRGHIRLLFLVPLIAGFVFSLGDKKPDILIDEYGRMIGVKQGPRLLAIGGRGSSYVAGRWLQYFGDDRPLTVARNNTAVLCDGQGCAARLKLGSAQFKQISLVRDRAILNEECYRADLLIVSDPVRVMPKDCVKPQQIISRLDLWRGGAHGLRYNHNSDWYVETVSEAQGERPWNRDWQYRQKRRLSQ